MVGGSGDDLRRCVQSGRPTLPRRPVAAARAAVVRWPSPSAGAACSRRYDDEGTGQGRGGARTVAARRARSRPLRAGEVLIRVLRTGICGTDLHIRSWDAWAQGAVKPPVVLGHEIAGRVEALGRGVDTVDVGDLVSVEGHIVCGRCRSCLAGAPPAVPQHGQRRRRPRRRLRRVRRRPGHERVAPPAPDRPRRRRDLRPVRQRRALGAELPGARRGRAHHRRRPDRHHGRVGGAARRRAARRHHRHQRRAARAGRVDGRGHPRGRRAHRRRSTTVMARPRAWSRASTSASRCPARPRRCTR